MSEQSAHRQIAPGPSLKSELPPGDSPPGENYRTTPMDPSKKRVSMACLACKKSKRKVCCGLYLRIMFPHECLDPFVFLSLLLLAILIRFLFRHSFLPNQEMKLSLLLTDCDLVLRGTSV